ncbi:hypothetical protein BWQ96_04624 [Gracilariopsis chorda]|uniref:Uncharacterized protein n=1 Tax=Gracilariopsis chorda TaxID=448386 RepID=A0A2V3IU42_9FLOR|nr:hypothetical protein BWQ96_04624 [Gracilariopsis chorda]|eukprot:PXF45619.1 hypothetical protein BWQ96_04624 [Gracilariopsis chorda]
MEKYSELARCVENIERDASKFFVNGNKAAGTRARKHLQELKQLAQDLRVLIQDTKNENTRQAQALKPEHDVAVDPNHAYDDQGPAHVGF